MRKNATNTQNVLQEQAAAVERVKEQLFPMMQGFEQRVQDVSGRVVETAMRDATRLATEASEQASAMKQDVVALQGWAAAQGQEHERERVAEVVAGNEKLRIRQEHQARNIDLIESKLSEQMATSEHLVKTLEHLTQHVGASHLKTWSDKTTNKK